MHLSIFFQQLFNDNMTVNLDQLHKYGIDGDPKVRKQKTAAENTDKVIVVGDRLAVLKAGGGT